MHVSVLYLTWTKIVFFSSFYPFFEHNLWKEEAKNLMRYEVWSKTKTGRCSTPADLAKVCFRKSSAKTRTWAAGWNQSPQQRAIAHADQPRARRRSFSFCAGQCRRRCRGSSIILTVSSRSPGLWNLLRDLLRLISGSLKPSPRPFQSPFQAPYHDPF